MSVPGYYPGPREPNLACALLIGLSPQPQKGNFDTHPNLTLSLLQTIAGVQSTQGNARIQALYLLLPLIDHGTVGLSE